MASKAVSALGVNNKIKKALQGKQVSPVPQKHNIIQQNKRAINQASEFNKMAKQSNKLAAYKSPKKVAKKKAEQAQYVSENS